MPTYTISQLARVHHATIINGRWVNADAVHLCDGARALSVAIADGAGDDRDAAECAQIAAQVAATVAASTGNPFQGLHAAKVYVDQRNEDALLFREGVSTATVLTIGSHEPIIRLAWVGDSPAWGVKPDGEVVGLTTLSCHPCMTPCNVSERHGALWPHECGDDLGAFARIILASDGLTAHLYGADRGNHVAALTPKLTELASPTLYGGQVLTQLLDLARKGGGDDNTTVAVIDLIDPEPGDH